MKQHELTTARGTLRWRGTAVMGILNVTPDSFSDGGRHGSAGQAISRGLELMNEGALLIDVGGESTRPGSQPVTAAEELRRVLPVIEGLAAMGVPVSSDTMKAEVAEAALAAGAWLVNDVSGLRDRRMLDVCAEAGAAAVIMHMQGTPLTMQDQPVYSDVVTEVLSWLSQQAAAAEQAGLAGVMIDPGIGFGKDLKHNLSLLRQLERFTASGWPLLVGVSRKGMLRQLGAPAEPARRDPASLALHLDAARRGAALVRVHDVAGHVQAITAQQSLLAEET